MKKLLILAVAASLALGSMPASAGKKKKGKKKGKARQEILGSVAFPMPNPTDETCITGNHRRANLYSDDAAQGIVGAHFEVDPRTVGKKFQLHALTGEDTDFDVVFYMGMGSQDDPGGAPANYAFEERAPGGEHGRVPSGYDTVIVCLYAGENAEFHYEAGAGVKFGSHH